MELVEGESYIDVEKQEILGRLVANPEKLAQMKEAAIKSTEPVQKLNNAFNRYRGKMLTSLEASALTGDSLIAMKKIFKNDTGELWNSIAVIVRNLETSNGKGKE